MNPSRTEGQHKPLGDIAQKQVTTPSGKKHRKDNAKKGRKTTLVGKDVSLGMP